MTSESFRIEYGLLMEDRVAVAPGAMSEERARDLFAAGIAKGGQLVKRWVINTDWWLA